MIEPIFCQIRAIKAMMVNHDDDEILAVIDALKAAGDDLLDELTRRANARARHSAGRAHIARRTNDFHDDRGG